MPNAQKKARCRGYIKVIAMKLSICLTQQSISFQAQILMTDSWFIQGPFYIHHVSRMSKVRFQHMRILRHFESLK